jgi:hypothetical protein
MAAETTISQGCKLRDDLAYFSRRASEERSAALHASSSRAQQAHKELADHYEELVASSAAIAEREQEIISNSLKRLQESWKLLKGPIFRAFEK